MKANPFLDRNSTVSGVLAEFDLDCLPAIEPWTVLSGDRYAVRGEALGSTHNPKWIGVPARP